MLHIIMPKKNPTFYKIIIVYIIFLKMGSSVLGRKYNAIHDIKLIFSPNPFRYYRERAIVSLNVYIILKDKMANDNA